MTLANDKKESLNLSSILSILFLTFCTYSLLYSIGYWGVFRVNIFTYASLPELLIAPLFSVVSVLLSYGLFILMFFISAYNDDVIKRRKNVSTNITILFSSILAAGVIVMVVYGLVSWQLNKLFYWKVILVFVVICGCVLACYCIRLGLNCVTSILLSCLVSLSMLFCYSCGNSDAFARFNDKTCKRSLLLVGGNGYSIAEDDVYIGKLGQFFFLRSRKSNTTIVVPQEQVEVLLFEPCENDRSGK